MKRKRKRRKGRRLFYNKLILCGLVFFVISGILFCRVVESGEDDRRRNTVERAERQDKEKTGKKNGRPDKKEEAEEREEEKKEEERKEEEKKPDDRTSFAVQPGVPVGTFEPSDEKVVYLTFDDGPSDKTQAVLDILDKYKVKATFFVTGHMPEYRPMIKKAYKQGHTIALHTYSHDYQQVYSSVDAYFQDLEAVGQVVKEQIGYVPCFIRFPGGASNTISANYCSGIMSAIAPMVQERGYQYYDWNCSSGDGGVHTAEELVQGATSSSENNIMILCHDATTKQTTVDALPKIIEHYQALGYTFKAIDRSSYVVQHGIGN